MHAPSRRPSFSRHPSLVRAVAVFAAIALAGCELPGFMAFPPQTRGNRVDDAQLKELVPGTTTRADVTSLIGSPTAHATFDDNTWIYIAEITRPVIAGTQGVLDQQVVVLTFDDQGVLRGVSRKTQDDSLPVNVVERTTPAPGSDATFLQELLGNVGKFNPGLGTSGANSGGTGGVGNALP